MDKILEEAEEMGPSFRLHDEHHVYLDENNQLYVENRFIPQGIDGIPNQLNAQDIQFGENFPDEANDGDYFLRIDYNPPRLFKRIINEETKEGRWQVTEYDNRTKWTGVPNILLRHINNDMTLTNEAGKYYHKDKILKI